MGFGHVPTPAKHVLLVHMNMLQGLKIHQGLKIRHKFTHKNCTCWLVNVEPRYIRWLGSRLTIQKFLVRTPVRDPKVFFLKSDSYRKLPQLSKRTCDYFSKTNRWKLRFSPCTVTGCDRGTPGFSVQQTTHWTNDVVSSSWYYTKVLGICPCFIGRFYNSANEWSWTNTEQLVFTKPCPQKGSMKTRKYVFQTF